MSRKHIFCTEEGTAMTEFAIMIPAIMILFFYSVFFTDLAEVKLKTLEASRYATWEATVYRPNASVRQEIAQRFANLRSTDLGEADTTHMIGVDNLRIETAYQDRLEVDMTGGAIPDPGNNGQGGGEDAVSGVDSMINTVIGWAKLPSAGKARAEVTFKVDNKIIPDFMLFNTRVRATSNESTGLSSGDGFAISSHHVMVFDTWKAWPNPNRLVGATNASSADPWQTYSIAETAIADQVRAIAFVKLGSLSITRTIGEVFSFFKLPSPLASYLVPEPTTIRAPESTNGVLSFSPTYGRNDTQRWGDRFSSSRILGDNPNPGIDHSRWTLPYSFSTGFYARKKITWWQTYAGAMVSTRNPANMFIRPRQTTLLQHQYENDYYLSYQCRGHYYDGMITEAGPIGDYRNYDGCNDALDTVQAGAQDLLTMFGSGISLPGF